MSKQILGFVHQLDVPLFIQSFSSLSKNILANPKDYTSKQSLTNLITNYKSYYNHYNKIPEALSTVAFWSKKMNIDDKKVGNIIQNQAPLSIGNFSNRSLSPFVCGIAGNNDMERLVIDHVVKNMSTLAPRELAEIVRYIPSPAILDAMLYRNKILIASELDLVFYIKSFRNIRALDFLEGKFCEVLLDIKKTQTLLTILYEFTNKNYYLKTSTLELVEQKLTDQNTEINLKDMNHTLIVFNCKSLYGKGTNKFGEIFEHKINRASDDWPVAIVLSYLAKNSFFKPALFGKLIDNGRTRVDRNRERLVFREGFVALSLTPYLTEELMAGSKTQILNMTHKFDTSDIVQIMRSCTLINNYDSEIGNNLVNRLSSECFKLLKPVQKSLLFNISTSLDIDRPSEYLEGIEKILSHKDEHYKIGREEGGNQGSTQYEETIRNFMKAFGYTYLQNEIISGLYEADILLPKEGVIVEFMGSPYHISQHNGEFHAKAKMKFRHLKILGWHVIAISNMKNFEENLMSSLKALEFHEYPHFIHLS